MNSKPSIAVLASGGGTTVEAFIRASVVGKVEPQVSLVITNNKNAGVIDRIKRLNQEFGLDIKMVHIGRSNYPLGADESKLPGEQTDAEEQALLETLRAGNFSAIVLMGYMKKVGKRLVDAFGWRSSYTSPHQAMMLNTHPGLLPFSKGLFGIHVQEQVLAKQQTEAGQTLHVVAEDYDDGPIIAENKLVVDQTETAEELFARVQILEKQSLPKDVAEFIKKRQVYLENNGGT